MMKCPPPHSQVYEYKETLPRMERFFFNSRSQAAQGACSQRACESPGKTLFSEDKACTLASWGTLVPWLNQCLWACGEPRARDPSYEGRRPASGFFNVTITTFPTHSHISLYTGQR